MRLGKICKNAIAKWLMDEIQSERKWDKLFSESEDALARLAQEALEEEKHGKTTELNIDQLSLDRFPFQL